MPGKWAEDTTLKFVELYKQHECLWNVSVAIYRNKQAREAAITQIVNDMGIYGFGMLEAKLKIKNLRTTYNQELLKIEKSKKSGAGPEDVYTPTLKWFTVMLSFIQNVKRPTQNYSENFTDTDKANESPGDVIETPTPQEDPDRETTNLKRSAASTGTLRVKRSKLGAESAFIQELKVLKECINQPSSENECDVFGKHVAMQLKTLSTEQRVLAQEAIQSAITHCRLQDLHKQCSSSCTEQFITESEKQTDGRANVEETWLKEEEEEYELGLNVEEIKSELQEVEEED